MFSEHLLIHRTILFLKKDVRSFCPLDSLLLHLQRQNRGLTTCGLTQLLRAYPSLFAFKLEDQIMLESQNIDFAETCFQISDNLLTTQQTDLIFNIADHQPYDVYVSKNCVGILNLRVHSINPTGVVFNPTGAQLYQVRWNTSQLNQTGNTLIENVFSLK